MLSNLPLFIGLRYMRSKRRDSFVSFISLFSLAAMAIGVMALIVVLSVMNGFDREIKMRLLRVVPHVTVTSPQGLDRAQINQLEAELKAGADDAPVQVLSVVPMLQSFVMGSSKGNQAGLVLQGIDPESRTGDKLAENMISGYVGQLQAGEFGVVIGSQVARKLDLFVGDRLQLTLPSVTVTPAGVFPRIKRVTVTGIFQVGAQVDASVVFIHYRDGQKLLRLGDRFQGVQLELSDAFVADNWLSCPS